MPATPTSGRFKHGRVAGRIESQASARLPTVCIPVRGPRQLYRRPRSRTHLLAETRKVYRAKKLADISLGERKLRWSKCFHFDVCLCIKCRLAPRELLCFCVMPQAKNTPVHAVDGKFFCNEPDCDCGPGKSWPGWSNTTAVNKHKDDVHPGSTHVRNASARTVCGTAEEVRQHRRAQGRVRQRRYRQSWRKVNEPDQ